MSYSLNIYKMILIINGDYMPIVDYSFTANQLRQLVMDTHSLIPTGEGTLNSIYFDNAATTPPFASVINEINKYTPWYKYVSKKSIKAKLISAMYEESRKSIKRFVNADMENDTVIYTKNTTEAINILSDVLTQQYPDTKPLVITTYMEHMSDYLPWKFRCSCELVNVTQDGRLSMEDLENKLKKYAGKVKLVAVAGANNVIGYVNPIHEIAELAHKHGAKIFVDAAQLIQHRRIYMNSPKLSAIQTDEYTYPANEIQKIDYLAFSAHKTYAPFFTGALIGDKTVLNQVNPFCFGAGITESVTTESVVLKESPVRYEAGSNNILGAIALATAIQTIEQTGFNIIQEYEASLLTYTINQLKQIPDVILYGDTNNTKDRIPIISFNIRNMDTEEVADYLLDNFGLIIKHGLCGSDLYVKKLIEGSTFSGVVRLSFGLYNQTYEIDRVITALSKLLL